MKKPLFLIILFVWCSGADAQQNGTFSDPRDGKTYNWVRIGNQVWMAENLAFNPESGSYRVYGNNQSFLEHYGFLYDWNTAQNVCPPGWSLPSDQEWSQLLSFLSIHPASKLKAKRGWSANSGADEFGFRALPGGYSYGSNSFSGAGDLGIWWSATEHNAHSAWKFSMTFTDSHVLRNSVTKATRYSVRCIKAN
jgi:uncharacterized protein (TIGR02145 family)